MHSSNNKQRNSNKCLVKASPSLKVPNVNLHPLWCLKIIFHVSNQHKPETEWNKPWYEFMHQTSKIVWHKPTNIINIKQTLSDVIKIAADLNQRFSKTHPIYSCFASDMSRFHWNLCFYLLQPSESECWVITSCRTLATIINKFDLKVCCCKCSVPWTEQYVKRVLSTKTPGKFN